MKAGGKDGRALSARTVGHVHRVLHRALQRAVENETLSRNITSLIHPPNVEAQEVEILNADEIGVVLAKLEGHALHPIVALALAIYFRFSKLLTLCWEDIKLNRAKIRIERALEETAAGASGSRLPRPNTAGARLHCRRALLRPCALVAALSSSN